MYNNEKVECHETAKQRSSCGRAAQAKRSCRRPRFNDETTTTESLASTTEDDKSVDVVEARA